MSLPFYHGIDYIFNQCFVKIFEAKSRYQIQRYWGRLWSKPNKTMHDPCHTSKPYTICRHQFCPTHFEAHFVEINIGDQS